MTESVWTTVYRKRYAPSFTRTGATGTWDAMYNLSQQVQDALHATTDGTDQDAYQVWIVPADSASVPVRPTKAQPQSDDDFKWVAISDRVVPVDVTDFPVRHPWVPAC